MPASRSRSLRIGAAACNDEKIVFVLNGRSRPTPFATTAGRKFAAQRRASRSWNESIRRATDLSATRMASAQSFLSGLRLIVGQNTLSFRCIAERLKLSLDFVVVFSGFGLVQASISFYKGVLLWLNVSTIFRLLI